MKKFIKQLFITLCLVALLVLPYFVFAANPLSGMQTVAEGGGYAQVDEFSLARIIGIAVSAFLSLLGIIFIILTLLAGYNWMTAGGSEEKIEKARKILYRSIIGLIITVGSYAIWEFVLYKFIFNL